MYLEDLAAACAEDGIYDFLFTASPLHVEMSTGAPINPVVVKASPGYSSGQTEDEHGTGKGTDNGRANGDDDDDDDE